MKLLTLPDADGSRDGGFGVQGLVSLDYKVDEGLGDVAVQGDGKIVAGGQIRP